MVDRFICLFDVLALNILRKGPGIPFKLRHLKYLVATAELGRVSRAATKLSVSRSALAAAIKALKSVLGAASFQPRAKGMPVTRSGRRAWTSQSPRCPGI